MNRVWRIGKGVRGPGSLMLLAASVMAPSTSAQAQSSVSLYGIVDAGFVFNSNAKGVKQYSLNSGNENGDRWGLVGSEDLGGGLKAVFNLESGFSITSGTMLQNSIFGRQADVGLSSSHFGTVTLGRQYSDVTGAVGPFTSGGNWAAGGAGYGTHPMDLDDLDNSNRISNAVKYQSVDYGGFTFGGLYSFGGTAGAVSQNQIYDFDIAYKHGPFAAAVGYLYANRPNFSLFGSAPTASATGINLPSVTIAGYATASSQQITAAGASYTLGPAIVGAVFSNVRFNNLGSVAITGLNPAEATYRGSDVWNIGEVNLKYFVTPSFMLGAAYTYSHDSGPSNGSGAHYNQINLGAIYNLSKRTLLYLIAVHQTASGTNSTGVPAVAAITGVTQSSSSHQTVATLGLLQKF